MVMYNGISCSFDGLKGTTRRIAVLRDGRNRKVAFSMMV